MKRKLKILHVLYELKPSGAEMMLKSAGKYWENYNIRSDILATGPEKGPFASELEEVGYNVFYLRNRKKLVDFIHFYRFVRNGKYDVIHQHAEGMSFWYGLFSLLAGARFLRTVHSNFSFNGNLRIRRGLQRKILNALGCKFITIGSSVKNNEWMRFRIESTVIANWADLEAFPPPSDNQREQARGKWGFSKDDFVVLTVGNCSRGKNHKSLIEAIASSSIANLKYLHVGSGEDEQSEHDLVSYFSLNERVVFAGRLPSAKEAFYASDAYIMPSLYEGFSIAAIEGLSVGIPMILADVPGLNDMRQFSPHIIFTKPDIVGLKDSLDRIYSITDVEREVIKNINRENALKFFGPERGVREYSTQYSILAHQKDKVK